MGGQIIDATMIEARRPCLTQSRGIPSKAAAPRPSGNRHGAQIDRDGRWTIERGRKREAAPGAGHQCEVGYRDAGVRVKEITLASIASSALCVATP
jgi:hypothetical protein